MSLHFWEAKLTCDYTIDTTLVRMVDEITLRDILALRVEMDSKRAVEVTVIPNFLFLLVSNIIKSYVCYPTTKTNILVTLVSLQG